MNNRGVHRELQNLRFVLKSGRSGRRRIGSFASNWAGT